MKKYEIMFIVVPTLGEDEVKEVVKNFENVITTNGGVLAGSKEIGKRELAYEIKKYKSGYYYLFEVETNNDNPVKEFDRLALINKNVIRHLITKIN